MSQPQKSTNMKSTTVEESIPVKAHTNRTCGPMNLCGTKMPGWLGQDEKFLYSDKYVRELVIKKDQANQTDPTAVPAPAHKRPKHCPKIVFKVSEKLQQEALKVDEILAKMVVKLGDESIGKSGRDSATSKSNRNTATNKKESAPMTTVVKLSKSGQQPTGPVGHVPAGQPPPPAKQS